jgi:hypothetical protein
MLGKILMSLAGGSGLGAALMYVFDPEVGKKHREGVEKVAGNWRGRLAEGLAEAAVRVAPKGKDENGMRLTPGQMRAGALLSRRAREHNVAEETYARARDVYYGALIDLDLARARGKHRGERSGDYLAAAGWCAAGAGVMYFLKREKSTG